MSRSSGRVVILVGLLVGLAAGVGGAAGAVAPGAFAPQGLAAAGTTSIVSVSSGGVVGNEESNNPSISADGRYVAFESLASNLVSNDDNGVMDVFVHDRQTGQTELISITNGGVQGDDQSWWPRLSADGRYVAFTSWATNLIEDSTLYSQNVLLKDRSTGDIELISVYSTGEEGGCSHDAAVSASGRYVAFYSCANLTADDANEDWDVFLRDRANHETRLISIGLGGLAGDDNSWGPVGITADGGEVFFSSWATNLVAGDNNDTLDVFAHNWQTGETEMLSVSSTGQQGDADTGGGDLSADGNRIILGSNATTLVPNDSNGLADVFLRNRVAGTTERISVTADGFEIYDGSSGNGAISPDGRFVAFFSRSEMVVAEDTNFVPDVFVYDVETGRSQRVSISSTSDEANDESFYLMDIAQDGRAVAFVSRATNLASGVVDNNNSWDIFVHEPAPPIHVEYFLPLIGVFDGVRPPCFPGPNEAEDNDTAATANGPLCAPGGYRGLPDDARDFFMFDTAAAGRVAIDVTNFYVPGMQLSLYYQSTSNPPVDFDTEPDDGLGVELPNAQPGRYFIRLYTDKPNPAETRPYTMQVTYP